MTGTGTQNDPYILTAAADLYAMEDIGGSGVYCELGCDIDLNGTQWAENFEPIPLNCSYFSGRGYKIRNMYKNCINEAPYAFAVMVSTIRLDNVFIENIVMSGTTVNVFKLDGIGSATVNMYNCAVSIQMNRNSFYIYNPDKNCVMHSSNITVNAELCTISVKGYFYTAYSIFKRGSFNRSQLLLDVIVETGADKSEDYASVFYECLMTDSWVSGKVKCSGSSAIKYHMTDRTSKISNCYQAVACENISIVYWCGDCTTRCFYDNTLMGNAECHDYSDHAPDLFSALTTAQCKDAEYLRSIGFNCGGGEDGWDLR